MTKRNNNKYFNYSLLSILVAIFALAISSCRDNDFDWEYYYNQVDAVKNAEYKANWNAAFGKIDAFQDWNAVSQVKAHIILDEFEDITGSSIKVFSGDPKAETSRLIAEYPVTARQMDIKFDALKYPGYVYVLRMRSNGYYASVVADIIDGECTANFAGQQFEDTRAVASTRANEFWSGTLPTEVPSDAKTVTGSLTNYDDASTNINLNDLVVSGKVNLYSQNNRVYVTGTVEVGEWYTGGNSKIYIMDGATLTISKGDFGQWQSEFIVCPGGKLVVEDILLSNNVAIVNYGTFEASSLSCATASVYNAATGNIKVKNSLTVNGNNAVWMNLGHFDASSATFNASSASWTNGCYMKVGHLVINPADAGTLFTNSSYVECETLDMNVSKVQLPTDAMLVVNGTATFKYNCWNDRKHGIVSTAEQGSWAVFKANKIVFDNNKQHGSASFVGNLIVDCPDMPKRTTDSGQESGYNWSLFNGAKLAEGGDSYTIPDNDCTKPYNPVPPTPPTETPVSYIIACEDLGATGDIDFNDVVFKVSHVAGQDFLKVTPLAAGGTLASTIFFQNGRELGEIHYLLNGTTGKSGSLPMLNTGYGNNQDPGPGQEITINGVAEDFTMAYSSETQNMGGFYITTSQKNETTGSNSIVIKGPTSGDAPQMILVPGDWMWPTERVNIAKAYPEFEHWSQDSKAYCDWYLHPDQHASIMNFEEVQENWEEVVTIQ